MFVLPLPRTDAAHVVQDDLPVGRVVSDGDGRVVAHQSDVETHEVGGQRGRPMRGGTPFVDTGEQILGILDPTRVRSLKTAPNSVKNTFGSLR